MALQNTTKDDTDFAINAQQDSTNPRAASNPKRSDPYKLTPTRIRVSLRQGGSLQNGGCPDNTLLAPDTMR